MKNFSSITIFCFLVLFSFSSCMKKKYDSDKFAEDSWDPNFAVPLVKSHFDVYDILARTDPNDLVVIDPATGLLALVYDGQAFSFAADEVVDLPSRTFNVVYSAAADFNVPSGTTYQGTQTASFTESFNYQPSSGEELHEILLMSGNLNIELSTTLMHDVELVINFPYLTSNGNPLAVPVTVLYDGSTPTASSTNIDLSNYLLDFSLGGTSFNEFAAGMNFTIEGTGEEVVGNEEVSVSLSLTNLNFTYISGYFGQQTVALDGDSILIKIFQNAVDGYFELTNPRLLLHIDNSFGFPVEIDIQELKTINKETGQEYPMAGYPNPFLIDAPPSVGQSVETTLEFNKDNTTNITNILSPTPRFLSFAFEGTSNPDGQTATLNFMEYNSQLTVDADLELTLEGFAYGFEFRDTSEFSFDDDIEEVDWVKLRVNITNGFPVQLDVQLYLMDENMLPIDTIIPEDNRVIVSGQINADGKVIQPTNKITDILITRDQIPNLLNAEHIVVHAEAKTKEAFSGQIVKIHDDNFMDLRLGMQVQGSVNF